MDSPAAHHFPPIVFRQGKKYLWNRINRKPLENLPEERVRIRYIDYLVLESDWPHSRIASEVAIHPPEKKFPLRADLICYTKDLKPEILIECKAESITLNEITAIQAGRYNRSLNASFICITNGIHDFWYQMKSEIPKKLHDNPLKKKTGVKDLRQNMAYWQERGFSGKKASVSLQAWLSHILPDFFSTGKLWETRFLNIQQQLPNLQFSHYYRLAEIHDSRRLAMTFLRSANERSYLAAILNENGKNRGILLVNLDQLFDGVENNSRIITNDNQKNLDVRPLLPNDFDRPDPRGIKKMPKVLNHIFEKNLYDP